MGDKVRGAMKMDKHYSYKEIIKMNSKKMGIKAKRGIKKNALNKG